MIWISLQSLSDSWLDDLIIWREINKGMCLKLELQLRGMNANISEPCGFQHVCQRQRVEGDLATFHLVRYLFQTLNGRNSYNGLGFKEWHHDYWTEAAVSCFFNALIQQACYCTFRLVAADGEAWWPLGFSNYWSEMARTLRSRVRIPLVVWLCVGISLFCNFWDNELGWFFIKRIHVTQFVSSWGKKKQISYSMCYTLTTNTLQCVILTVTRT
jgi:hypothetical protein